MQALTWFVATSLAANVVLGIWFAHQRKSTRPAAAADAPASAQPSTKPSHDSSVQAPGVPAWTEFETVELADVAARFRAEGWAPEVVRVMTRAVMGERVHERRLALHRAAGDYDYWRTQGVPRTPEQEAARDELQKLYGTFESRLDELLGPEPETEYDRALRWREFGAIPKDKVDQIVALRRDYREVIDEIREKAQGVLTPEERRLVAKLEQELENERLALLTAEERREYERRSSPAADRTRSRLGAFEATEEEFLAALALQQTLPLEGEVSRAELDGQFAEQFAAILGEERFEEFRLKSDPAWREIDGLVTRLKLPPAVTRNVVSVQRELQQRVKAAHAATQLSPEQRAVELRAVVKEARAQLGEVLGPAGLEAYEETVGRWLKREEDRIDRAAKSNSPKP